MSETVGWLALLQGAVVLLIAVSYLVAPGPRGGGGLLGWPVAPGWETSPEADGVRRRYRRQVVAWSAAALALAGLAALGDGAPGIALASAVPVLQVVGCALAWRAARRSILPHLVPGDSATVRRASLAPSGGALRPLLDLGGLLPLGLAALWLQAHFDRIPARYVIHWGPSGPDGWGTNTPRQVYAPLLLGAALVLLFAGLHWLIRALTPAGVSPRQRAGRDMAFAALTGAGWFVGALLAAVSFTALGAGPVAVIGVAVAGMAALAATMIWQLVRLSRLPPEPAPAVSNPAAWRAGGLFYVAPDDPAIFVPKAVGVGWTVNLGHWRGQLALAVLVLLPLAVAFGSIWLAR